jgi:uncharacterized protein (TIGR03435 family)
MFRIGRGQLDLQGANMGAIAAQLSNMLGRVVVDKTGLDGSFDVKLEWTPEPGQGGPMGFGPPPPGAPDAHPPADSSGPTIFTAVQEQLGLRLESQKGPVEMVVIDRVEKPTAN